MYKKYSNIIHMVLSKRSGFLNSLQRDLHKFIRTPIIEKILYILLLIIIINIVMYYITPVKEGFAEKKELVVKRGRSIYDNFYVNIYDDIFYNKLKTDYEIGTIQNNIGPTQESLVLDVGSGTGHHVKEMNDNNIHAIGIDVSPDMVEKAKENFPALTFREKDALRQESFGPSTFTHVTCFNHTIYYFQNKERFLHNCFYWLKPGGCLILHLVDKDHYDPVMPTGDPYTMLPSKYVSKKEKNTFIKFVGYDYKSNIEVYPNDSTAVLHERFKDVKTGNIRKQELLLYMPTRKRILNIAKDTGFIVLGEVNMDKIDFPFQYMYILQKPN